MSQRAWSQDSDIFRPVSTMSLTQKLVPGIYIPGADTQGYYLTQYHDKYVFPYKVYGVNKSFIERVNRTFVNTTGNLGVLMNGVKGTGKSVTSELICNDFMEQFNMPVILINERMRGLIEFLAAIDQDVVVFVDEYEKVFVNEEGRPNSTEILTLMDGALKSEHRRLFLFTTNNKYIDDNLLERPGRIRYVKEFTDLDKATIEEIVDDLLENKDFKEECIAYISKLQKITIDIVKAVITEVNIHGQGPSSFSDIFNAKELKPTYNMYTGALTSVQMAIVLPTQTNIERCEPYFLEASEVNKQRWCATKRDVFIDGEYMGEFVSFVNMVLTVSNEDDNDNVVLTQFTFEKAMPVHKSYAY
jgi:archaellum biogenesis ATPase FlaH